MASLPCSQSASISQAKPANVANHAGDPVRAQREVNKKAARLFGLRFASLYYGCGSFPWHCLSSQLNDINNDINKAMQTLFDKKGLFFCSKTEKIH